MMNNVASLQAAPVAACLLLVAGIGAGSLGGYEFAQNRAAHAAVCSPRLSQPPSKHTAAAGRGRAGPRQRGQYFQHCAPAQQRDGGSELQPVGARSTSRARSTIPAIRQLLMLATENSSSAGVRDDSVGLLAAECRAGHSCQAAGIRDALMVALRYDKNAGVREKALEGLEPYVAEDMRVRNAVLEALLNDNDPRIRTASINILEPVEADTSVRQVLYSVSNSDDNPQIRNVSRQVLSRVPEIQ